MVTDAWLTRCITIRIVIYSISWLGKANLRISKEKTMYWEENIIEEERVTAS